MKQRVGLARAFALSPKLLLLDEPFGMLDALTRWDLQEVLMEVWRRNRVTAICVTHDVDEAILLADRVVMMTNGPHARIGNIMHVDLPRPRTRKALLEHPKYYDYREELLRFLAECAGNRCTRGVRNVSLSGQRARHRLRLSQWAQGCAPPPQVASDEQKPRFLFAASEGRDRESDPSHHHESSKTDLLGDAVGAGSGQSCVDGLPSIAATEPRYPRVPRVPRISAGFVCGRRTYL